MSLGPFLRRELILSVRSGRAFSDRRGAAFLAAGFVLGSFLLWDYRGWDRTSIVGGRRFGLVTFGLMVAGMMLLAVSIVGGQVALSIASERERKSLDALLASRFSGLEIVLGSMAVGLFRFANAVAAAVPVVVLIVFLGGVAPTWAMLAGAMLASTALLMAAVAVAASVGAKTGARALNGALGWFGLWVAFPMMFLMLRPLVWPGAPSWLVSLIVQMSDGGPLGLVTNFARIAPRPGGPVEAVVRMVAWQVGGSLVLTAWAVARLRPASRGLYDVEGQATRIKMIKAALRRPPRRPPCYDDPVLWHEIHSARWMGLAGRLFSRAVNLAWLGALAVGTWWFAAPAFSELSGRGYGPSPEAFTMPELNPFVRVIASSTFARLTLDVAPGQARLEFNIVLRLFSAMAALGYVIMAFSNAFEGIKQERRRDTWLGLIATPLTGREILRAKALGSLWKARDTALTLIGLWTIGLLAGAVHPLGYLASLAFLAASGAFYSALGLSMALRECDPEKRAFEAISPVHLPIALAAVLLMTGGPVALAWASLLSYEDVEAVIRSGPFPQLGGTHIGVLMGARAVVITWLVGTGALALGALLLVRANERVFDESVGRPTRVG